MPRTHLHAAFPGPSPFGVGFGGTLLRILFSAAFLILAFFVVLLTVGLGLIFLLLRTLGIGPKWKAPSFMPFQNPFQTPTSGAPPTAPDSSPGIHKDLPEELEAFHGSLDEFMQSKKEGGQE